MAYEQHSIPLTGDILEDLAMAFRELITKVDIFFFPYILSVIILDKKQQCSTL